MYSYYCSAKVIYFPLVWSDCDWLHHLWLWIWRSKPFDKIINIDQLCFTQNIHWWNYSFDRTWDYMWLETYSIKLPNFLDFRNSWKRWRPIQIWRRSSGPKKERLPSWWKMCRDCRPAWPNSERPPAPRSHSWNSSLAANPKFWRYQRNKHLILVGSHFNFSFIMTSYVSFTNLRSLSFSRLLNPIHQFTPFVV